jgi:uncharacterized protein
MAMTALTPAQVLERRRQVLTAHDIDGFIDLFASDGVIELPFAGPGMPRRLEGRAAIREFSDRAEASPLRIDDLVTVELYQPADPEVVIVELRTCGHVATTGATFEATSIQVFRIRDGEILLLRDYFSPSGLADLLGG